MNEINLDEIANTVRFKLGGSSFDINIATLGQLEDLEKSAKNDSELSEVAGTIKILTTLGFPEDVARKLNSQQMTLVIESLAGANSKKNLAN